MSIDRNYFVWFFIDENVNIGEGTKWHFSHIQSGAKIGFNCTLDRMWT